MTTCGVSGATILHFFPLVSALDGDEWSAVTLRPLYPAEEAQCSM